MNNVLRAPFPGEAPFRPIFKPWRRQSMACAAPMLFRVLIELCGISAHAWHLSTAALILSTSGSNLRPTPDTVTKEDLGCFRVVAWCIDPDLIPQEKIIVVREPEEEYVEAGLFLRPEENLYPKRLSLRYRVIVRLIKVQDWHVPSDDSALGTPPDRGNSDSEDDYPGFE